MQRELEEQRVRREEEERIRREEEERIRREEEGRKAREERDRRREASISAQIERMAEMEARLKCMKRKLEGDMAALPTAQRARFAGPIAAGLRPLREWTHETALSWFDDTFAFWDLYREHFRPSRRCRPDAWPRDCPRLGSQACKTPARFPPYARCAPSRARCKKSSRRM